MNTGKLPIPLHGCTFVPLPESATDKLLRELGGGKDCEAKDMVKEFLFIASMILENYSSFSYSDVVSTSQSLDIPADELQTMFDKWSKRMLKDGRIARIDGAYNAAIYSVCN